MEERHN